MWGTIWDCEERVRNSGLGVRKLVLLLILLLTCASGADVFLLLSLVSSFTVGVDDYHLVYLSYIVVKDEMR